MEHDILGHELPAEGGVGDWGVGVVLFFAFAAKHIVGGGDDGGICVGLRGGFEEKEFAL